MPSFAILPEPLQRRYNQLYALGANEVFAVFEVDFICDILVKLSKTLDPNSDLFRSLQNFRLEEIKHAQMFHSLNQAACPEYYQKNSYFLSRAAHPMGLLTLKAVKTFPEIFGLWVWIALFFEERSLVYSKHYLLSENSSLNSHFREIHKLHMLEETHHVQLDEVFVHHFYVPLSPWKRNLTAKMLKSMLASYAAPRRMSFAIAGVLQREFPQFQTEIRQCLKELPLLKDNKDFYRRTMGPAVTARTRKLLAQFPELKSIFP